MFLTTEVLTLICSMVHLTKISVKYFGMSMQEFFSRLLAVNNFFPKFFPFLIFFVLLLNSPPTHFHTFLNGPSLTGLVFILAECPPTLHPIVCRGGSFRDQLKEP